MHVESVPVASLVLDPANARKHDCERFFAMVARAPSGCWDFAVVQPRTGYGKFFAERVTWRAHRWVMWALGRIERRDERCVLHRCDNRRCVNPDHLYLGDRLQNAQDIKARGRSHLIRDPKLGSRNPSAKLTESAAREIRAALRRGERGKDVASTFGVSQAVVSEIKTGKLWAHALSALSATGAQ